MNAKRDWVVWAKDIATGELSVYKRLSGMSEGEALQAMGEDDAWECMTAM